MIIEWTYGAYAQLQRYFSFGYAATESVVYSVATGRMSVTLSGKSPAIAFSDRSPDIGFTSRKPSISFIGD